MTADDGTAAGLLRRLRREQGRSLRDASTALGVAPSQLSRIERGERRSTPEVAEKIATYYGVPRDLLELAEGRVPEDIVEILQNNPNEIDRLRDLYGSPKGKELDVAARPTDLGELPGGPEAR